MRKSLLALVALASAFFAIAETASAADWGRPDVPRGFGHTRTVRHWVYYPRYRNVYFSHYATDPYYYQYTPRGYYPYYNSGYWGAPRIHRFRGHLPPYYAAWGSHRKGYHHRAWHWKHHGHIRRGHW